MTVDLVVHLVSLLMVVYTAHFLLEITRADRSAGLGLAPHGVLLVGLAIGLANGFWPPLAALRETIFIVQPLMIVGMILFLTTMGRLPRGAAFVATAEFRPFLRVGIWRAVFGGLLLVIGLMGGLPGGFFWSVALGDIAVGLWAVSMLARASEPSNVEKLAWNAVGLFDLLHALVLGAIHLQGFYRSNPDVERLTLLPLFGVPLFIAMHVLLIKRLRQPKPAMA